MKVTKKIDLNTDYRLALEHVVTLCYETASIPYIPCSYDYTGDDKTYKTTECNIFRINSKQEARFLCVFQTEL